MGEVRSTPWRLLVSIQSHPLTSVTFPINYSSPSFTFLISSSNPLAQGYCQWAALILQLFSLFPSSHFWGKTIVAMWEVKHRVSEPSMCTGSRGQACVFWWEGSEQVQTWPAQVWRGHPGTQVRTRWRLLGRAAAESFVISICTLRTPTAKSRLWGEGEDGGSSPRWPGLNQPNIQRTGNRGGLNLCPPCQILALPPTMEDWKCTRKDEDYGSCSRYIGSSEKQVWFNCLQRTHALFQSPAFSPQKIFFFIYYFLDLVSGSGARCHCSQIPAVPWTMDHHCQLSKKGLVPNAGDWAGPWC
jgi:hypothetical protein